MRLFPILEALQVIDGKETMNDNGQSVRCAAIIQSGERCKLQAQVGSA